MESKTTGAWVVHHSQKLQQVTDGQEFNKILAAGKAGTLLSALSSDEQTSLLTQEVEALARAGGINVMFELPKLLDLLKFHNLIETSQSGIDVLGVTTGTVLQHTASIFNGLQPSASEMASIELSEIVSQAPRRDKESKGYLSDTFHLSQSEASGLLEHAEQVGFIDFEDLGGGQRIYFNGNLFRRDNVQKVEAVLDSLSSEEKSRVADVEAYLKQAGCLTVEDVSKRLGAPLFEKLNAISMYDVSIVNNETENVAFVTRPAAFSKYGNALVEDALDLAKAFVSSLTYGMTKSYYARGRITMIEKLMKALIAGRWIGPVEAIGQDYRALEMKRVVQVEQVGSRKFKMRLLKKDVGEIALQVIKGGDASDSALFAFPSATVTGYVGPELNRERHRRKQTVMSKKATRDIIMTLRTGGTL
jgi:hypothetical protein